MINTYHTKKLKVKAVYYSGGDADKFKELYYTPTVVSTHP